MGVQDGEETGSGDCARKLKLNCSQRSDRAIHAEMGVSLLRAGIHFTPHYFLFGFPKMKNPIVSMALVLDLEKKASTVDRNYSQPLSRAIRAASTRLLAPNLLMASER